MLKRKANFGCGEEILDGYENYDLNPSNKQVKKLNINKIPYQFEDNTFDEIICRHVLEHLDVNAYEVMKEFRRITKENGKIIGWH